LPTTTLVGLTSKRRTYFAAWGYDSVIWWVVHGEGGRGDFEEKKRKKEKWVGGGGWLIGIERGCSFKYS
jgi:hypothetical protein